MVETLPEIENRVTCKECGKIRMNTPSGSVCPDGHGKLYPSVSARAKRAVLRWREIRDLPEPTPAFQFKNIWKIEGEKGYFKRVTRWEAGRSNGSKKVQYKGRVRFCIPYTSRMIEAAERRAEAEVAK